MAFDSISSISNVGSRSTSAYERTPQTTEVIDVDVKPVETADNSVNIKDSDADAKDSQNERQQASNKSVEDAVKRANNKMTKTHCEFSYNNEVNRVSITVYDDTTGKVIKEIPPEESLKMLEKLWEIAGLMVDEKR